MSTEYVRLANPATGRTVSVRPAAVEMYQRRGFVVQQPAEALPPPSALKDEWVAAGVDAGLADPESLTKDQLVQTLTAIEDQPESGNDTEE